MRDLIARITDAALGSLTALAILTAGGCGPTDAEAVEACNRPAGIHRCDCLAAHFGCNGWGPSQSLRWAAAECYKREKPMAPEIGP